MSKFLNGTVAAAVAGSQVAGSLAIPAPAEAYTRYFCKY